MIRLILYPFLIYTVLVVLMRLIGKRQLGELELSELIVTILISEVAATPITDPHMSLIRALIPVLILLGMEFLMSVLALKSVRFRAIAEGKPSLLVVRGRIDQEQMRKNRITPDELAEALRSDGILDLRDVEYAVLETSGIINVIPTPEKRPVTAGDMGLTPEDAGYPVIVIDSGRVLSDNLRVLGKDERWLADRLAEAGIAAPDQVYMMTADMDGGVFLSKKEAHS